MCRLLAFKSERFLTFQQYLQQFAEGCYQSKEYQGHGWGMYYNTPEGPRIFHALNPIWEFDFSGIETMNYCLVHARSAFKDEGIHLSNNMPFISGNYQYIFNGELHGVRIKSQGQTGAWKLFHLFLKLTKDNTETGLRRTMDVIAKKSDYIKAANIIIGDNRQFYIYSNYREDFDYFTLHEYTDRQFNLISSVPFEISGNWSDVVKGEVISR